MRHGRSPIRRARPCVLAALCLLQAGVAVAAPKVYYCAAADGPAHYQDRPCADPARQRVVIFAPAPAAGTPQPDATRAVRTAPARRPPARRVKARAAVNSWECRAANGEVFYRHSRCPGSIPDSAASARGRRGATRNVAVRAVEVTRREACRRIGSGGASGRRGREHDETVSTYERNLGRDPCRRF